MEIYEILTARRKEKGISLIELSRISGVPKGSVDKIMSGASRNPGITPLIAIAHALDLTLDDLDTKEEPATVGELSESESEFIQLFGAMTPANRRLILGIAQLLLKEQAAPADSPD